MRMTITMTPKTIPAIIPVFPSPLEPLTSLSFTRGGIFLSELLCKSPKYLLSYVSCVILVSSQNLDNGRWIEYLFFILYDSLLNDLNSLLSYLFGILQFIPKNVDTWESKLHCILETRECININDLSVTKAIKTAVLDSSFEIRSISRSAYYKAIKLYKLDNFPPGKNALKYDTSPITDLIIDYRQKGIKDGATKIYRILTNGP